MKKITKRVMGIALTLIMLMSLLPTTALAEAHDWDPQGPGKFKGKVVGTETFHSSTTMDAEKDGYLRVMPILEGLWASYNAMAYCGAKATSSNPDIVDVKSIEIGKWQGGPWDNADCLQVTVNPKNAGRAVVTINFYYTFNQSSNPFNNRHAKWFYGEMKYTVNVEGQSEYTVTFQAGEHGKLNEAAKTVSDAYKYGAEFPTAPNTTPDKHFEFDGWYDGDTKVETFPATVTKSVTYTAHWKQVSYCDQKVTSDGAGHHWGVCSICGEKSTETFDCADTMVNGKCVVCGYELPHNHKYYTVCNNDGTHSFKCECGDIKATLDCEDANKDGFCDSCKYKMHDCDQKVTITFKVVNGTWADGSTTDKAVEIDKGAVLNSDQIPTGMKANSGCKTGAWSADLTGKQDQDATYTYKFEKESSSSSSSGSSSRTSKKYTLKYDTNDGKKISSESKSKKWTKDFEDLPVPTKKGYEFAGWYYNEKLTKKVKTDVDVDATTVILYAKWVEASELPFTDVDVNDSYYEAVKYCYDNNIFKGTTDTTFAPYSTLTRGQMVTVLWRLNGSPEPEHANPFTDVAATSPFAKAIAWAAENKLTNGVTETTFVPNQAISRQQFLTILYRYAVAMQYDVTVKNADEVLADYPDAENVSAYAVPAMQWAISTGVAGAVDGMLAPTDPAPRYQVAEFLANFCQEVVSR